LEQPSSDDTALLASPDGLVPAEPCSPPRWREVVETLLWALTAFALLRQVVQNYRVEGPSMQPTLRQGQYLVANRLAYRLGTVQRGDIVVFEHPRDASRALVKRVVALPEEELEIIRGQVHINGRALLEPYVARAGHDSFRTTRIGTDHVFVLGDNRSNSGDSRSWGSLPVRRIIGKAVFCYWPLGDWGVVGHALPVGAEWTQSRKTEPR